MRNPKGMNPIYYKEISLCLAITLRIRTSQVMLENFRTYSFLYSKSIVLFQKNNILFHKFSYNSLIIPNRNKLTSGGCSN